MESPSADPSDEEKNFEKILEIECLESRQSALSSIECPKLRKRIEQLLSADELAESPLDVVPVNELDVGRDPILGARIGNYLIEELVGEGGMGAVYRASQTFPFERQVALKILHGWNSSKRVRDRFAQEHAILATLRHPNIAHVHDAGSFMAGLPYFVMEFVDGPPITKFCSTRNPPVEERLRLFRDACLAIHHAHQSHVIHRDIKPSNVLVTQIDGVPVVKVIDFGIAKAIGPSTYGEHTLTGLPIGTPAYMSPEQLECSSVPVDTRSDVYSLGALLYEIICGAAAFSSDLPDEGRPLESVPWSARGEPIKPWKMAKAGGTPIPYKVAIEVDKVVMKALERSPNNRYQTAKELAEEIDRILGGEPVIASSGAASRAIRGFIRRRMRLVSMTAILAVAMVVSMLVKKMIDARLARTAEESRMASKATSEAAALLEEFTDVKWSVERDFSLPENTVCLKRLAKEDHRVKAAFVWLAIRNQDQYRNFDIHSNMLLKAIVGSDEDRSIRTAVLGILDSASTHECAWPAVWQAEILHSMGGLEKRAGSIKSTLGIFLQGSSAPERILRIAEVFALPGMNPEVSLAERTCSAMLSEFVVREDDFPSMDVDLEKEMARRRRDMINQRRDDVFRRLCTAEIASRLWPAYGMDLFKNKHAWAGVGWMPPDSGPLRILFEMLSSAERMKAVESYDGLIRQLSLPTWRFDLSRDRELAESKTVFEVFMAGPDLSNEQAWRVIQKRMESVEAEGYPIHFDWLMQRCLSRIDDRKLRELHDRLDRVLLNQNSCLGDMTGYVVCQERLTLDIRTKVANKLIRKVSILGGDLTWDSLSDLSLLAEIGDSLDPDQARGVFSILMRRLYDDSWSPMMPKLATCLRHLAENVRGESGDALVDAIIESLGPNEGSRCEWPEISACVVALNETIGNEARGRLLEWLLSETDGSPEAWSFLPVVVKRLGLLDPAEQTKYRPKIPVALQTLAVMNWVTYVSDCRITTDFGVDAGVLRRNEGHIESLMLTVPESLSNNIKNVVVKTIHLKFSEEDETNFENGNIRVLLLFQAAHLRHLLSESEREVAARRMIELLSNPACAWLEGMGELVVSRYVPLVSTLNKEARRRLAGEIVQSMLLSGSSCVWKELPRLLVAVHSDYDPSRNECSELVGHFLCVGDSERRLTEWITHCQVQVAQGAGLFEPFILEQAKWRNKGKE